MPIGSPAGSKTVKGSIVPFLRSPSRRAISASTSCGAGMKVYQSRQSSPSATASASFAACFAFSGVSVACRPRSVTSSGQTMAEPSQRGLLSCRLERRILLGQPVHLALYRPPLFLKEARDRVAQAGVGDVVG